MFQKIKKLFLLKKNYSFKCNKKQKSEHRTIIEAYYYYVFNKN